jgi:hypothetical protein
MQRSISARNLFFGTAAALLPAVCAAGLYGNDTLADARPIMADGTAYVDQMTSVNTNAWFTFRMEPGHSYSIDVWNPYGKRGAVGNRCIIGGVFELDGTPIPTTGRVSDSPAPQPDAGSIKAGRETLIASGIARSASVHVSETGAPPASPTKCMLRVANTTLVSPRWSVNGYDDLIAISHVAASFATVGLDPVSGYVLYFNEAGALVGSDAFSLASNASVQIVKPNGVAIGGATRGGIRIVHDGSPEALVAHQLWHNPVTNAYIQYPFHPLAQSYARGGMAQ